MICAERLVRRREAGVCTSERSWTVAFSWAASQEMAMGELVVRRATVGRAEEALFGRMRLAITMPAVSTRESRTESSPKASMRP
jgi:hypothetical protein